MKAWNTPPEMAEYDEDVDSFRYWLRRETEDRDLPPATRIIDKIDMDYAQRQRIND